MQHDADAPARSADYVDLLRADDGNVTEPHRAGRRGRVDGGDVSRRGERDADDVVVIHVVALEQLLQHLDDALGDVLRLVAVDGCRGAQGSHCCRHPHKVVASIDAARSSARTSSVSSDRHCPGASCLSAIGPILVRTSLITGWPTASSMRRTWRLRPSWIVMRTTFGSTSVAFAGAVIPSSSSTPSRSLRSDPRDGRPSTSATYSLATPKLGCVSRCVRSPSLVRRRSPSVFWSSRPTGKTRGSDGTSSVTVRRPCGSPDDVTTPQGLFSR